MASRRRISEANENEKNILVKKESKKLLINIANSMEDNKKQNILDVAKNNKQNTQKKSKLLFAKQLLYRLPNTSKLNLDDSNISEKKQNNSDSE